MNTFCSCSLEIEDISHYLLQYHHFNHQRIDLMSSVKSACHNFESMSDNSKKDVLLYGYSRFDENKKKIYFRSHYKLYKTF